MQSVSIKHILITLTSLLNLINLSKAISWFFPPYQAERHPYAKRRAPWNYLMVLLCKFMISRGSGLQDSNHRPQAQTSFCAHAAELHIPGPAPYYPAINFPLLLIKKLRCETQAKQRTRCLWNGVIDLHCQLLEIQELEKVTISLFHSNMSPAVRKTWPKSMCRWRYILQPNLNLHSNSRLVAS